MRRTVWTSLAVGAVVMGSALPAHAQAYRWDFGVNGGYSWYSESLDEEHFFLLEDEGFLLNDVSAEFDDGWLAGAQLTYWVPSIFGWDDRLGIRANFAYTERPFDVNFDFDEFPNGVFDVEEFEAVSDVNLWSGTGDLLFRFGEPDREFDGVEWLPYLALGAGAKWVDPAGSGTFGTIVDIDDDLIDDDLIGDDLDGAIFGVGDQLFVLDEGAKFMGLIGLGTDIRLAERFALRAEVGDRIWDSPIKAVEFDEEDDVFFLSDDEDVGNVIHEVYGQLGLHVLFGLEQPEEVAVVAPPAPPAPPAEEAVTVCVIDPMAPGGIQEIRAVYVPASGDTLVTVNGQRVAIDQAFQERVVVVEDEDWYVAGEPLEIGVNGETAEFVTYGGARVISPDEVAYIGTIDGLPVYADEDEVQDIREEIEELREAQADDDLEDILEQRDDLREDFDDIEVLYTPLEAVGCVFQPVRRVEEVRKVRG